MGRKLLGGIISGLILLFLGLLFASFYPSFAQSDNLRIYVRMSPEKPNGADGWSFEDSDVRVKLQMFDLNDNPSMPPTKIIDHKLSGFKILYVWDNLDTTKVVEYQEPFQPLEGGHFLFAYAVNSDGIYQTPATKFFIQFNSQKRNVVPTLTKMQNVYVSPDYVKWGSQGNYDIQENKNEKTGMITEEATSVAKTVSVSPKENPYGNENLLIAKIKQIFQQIKDFVKSVFAGQKNIWILLLGAGIFLLVGVKLVFRNRK